MKVVKLKEVISEFIVPMRDKPKVFSGSIPWCKIEDISGKYLYGSKSHKYVSNKTIELMNLKVYPLNTLLFTCSATIGVTAITKVSLCTNQTFIGLVPSNKIDVEFLYYYLFLIGKDLKKAASVTTIPYLSRMFFENLELEIPDRIIQESNSKILSDLDAKIELNNKINQELGAMAKLLYDYWFVQFDFPNKEGKPYKSSGGKMIYSEALKREIPEGWEIEKLSFSCKIIDCLHSKKSDYSFEDEKYYLLQLNNIRNDGLIDLSKKYYVSSIDYNKWTGRIEVQDNDLVITNAGRVAGLAQIPKFVIAGIGRNITAIRPETIEPTFLYYTFKGAEMERQIKLNTDTGSFFNSLNVRGIKELLVVRPPKDLEEKFEQITLPQRRKRELNQKENQKLAELRDWLLPMLMNGQVTVGNYKETDSNLGVVAEKESKYGE
ncbi:type I restriction enzyme, S subunit [Tenacibaculum sp. 190524A02b]|uniref:Type I restriction enzyme, S subunit n=1 Tax=Tenacibaculum vairaonense TaxID=3137860 RepID=A0ABP1FAS3_9FLAO